MTSNENDSRNWHCVKNNNFLLKKQQSSTFFTTNIGHWALGIGHWALGIAWNFARFVYCLVAYV